MNVRDYSPGGELDDRWTSATAVRAEGSVTDDRT